MMRTVLLAVVVGVCAAAAPLAAAPQSWEFREGRWQQIQAPSTAPVVRDPTMDRVEELLGKSQNTAARKMVLQWLLRHPDSPLRDQGLLLMARALYQYGDRIKAFYYCDELMDTYPESLLFYPALELQYQAAEAFLSGYKTRFLYLPLFTAEEDGVEMMFRIQQRAPGSPLAEKALRRTADYYYAQSDFDLAADAYGAYARSYPRSPDLPVVRLRQAFSALAQFRGIRFDATPLIDARAQLVDVASAYPDLAAQENLLSVIERIDATFARKVYDRGDFYVRTHQPQAAAYHFRFLIRTYPGSAEAKLAQQRLDKLPQWARTGMEPAVTGGYAPSTRPQEELLPANPLRSTTAPGRQ